MDPVRISFVDRDFDTPAHVYFSSAIFAALVSLGGSQSIGVALFGLLLMYALKLADLSELSALCFCAAMAICSFRIIYIVGVLSFSPLFMLLMETNVIAFCAQAVVWGLLQLQASRRFFDILCLELEHVLLISLPITVSTLGTWFWTVHFGFSYAPFFHAFLCSFLTLCSGSRRMSSFLAVTSRGQSRPESPPLEACVLQPSDVRFLAVFSMLSPVALFCALHSPVLFSLGPEWHLRAAELVLLTAAPVLVLGAASKTFPHRVHWWLISAGGQESSSRQPLYRSVAAAMAFSSLALLVRVVHYSFQPFIRVKFPTQLLLELLLVFHALWLPCAKLLQWRSILSPRIYAWCLSTCICSAMGLVGVQPIIVFPLWFALFLMWSTALHQRRRVSWRSRTAVFGFAVAAIVWLCKAWYWRLPFQSSLNRFVGLAGLVVLWLVGAVVLVPFKSGNQRQTAFFYGLVSFVLLVLEGIFVQEDMYPIYLVAATSALGVFTARALVSTLGLFRFGVCCHICKLWLLFGEARLLFWDLGIFLLLFITFAVAHRQRHSRITVVASYATAWLIGVTFLPETSRPLLSFLLQRSATSLEAVGYSGAMVSCAVLYSVRTTLPADRLLRICAIAIAMECLMIAVLLPYRPSAAPDSFKMMLASMNPAQPPSIPLVLPDWIGSWALFAFMILLPMHIITLNSPAVHSVISLATSLALALPLAGVLLPLPISLRMVCCIAVGLYSLLHGIGVLVQKNGDWVVPSLLGMNLVVILACAASLFYAYSLFAPPTMATVVLWNAATVNLALFWVIILMIGLGLVFLALPAPAQGRVGGQPQTGLVLLKLLVNGMVVLSAWLLSVTMYNAVPDVFLAAPSLLLLCMQPSSDGREARNQARGWALLTRKGIRIFAIGHALAMLLVICAVRTVQDYATYNITGIKVLVHGLLMIPVTQIDLIRFLQRPVERTMVPVLALFPWSLLPFFVTNSAALWWLGGTGIVASIVLAILVNNVQEAGMNIL